MLPRVGLELPRLPPRVLPPTVAGGEGGGVFFVATAVSWPLEPPDELRAVPSPAVSGLSPS